MKRVFGRAASVLAIVVLVTVIAAGRHAILWSPTEPVTIASGDVTLAGTIAYPDSPGPHPAILMLHGSGPEARLDFPDRAVVNVLTDAGFAVLFYDKRGVGESGGNFDDALYHDFIDDALAALDYLAGRPDVDQGRIGLYVISESGWFAPEIATRSAHVGFIFNKVGPPLSWIETVAWEVRNDLMAEGIAESDVDRVADHAIDRWRYYIAAADDPSLADGPERSALAAELEHLRQEVPGADDALPESLWGYDPDGYARFAAKASYSSAHYLEQLDIPMYYAYGSDDINVPTEKCVGVLERLIREHDRDIEYHVYPGVGHGLVGPRGILRLGWPDGYLERLVAWTTEQVK